jgi:glycerol-3-phosphate dehydrogenase (NAD(P)+)
MRAYKRKNNNISGGLDVKSNISIFGAGSMSTALAILLAKKGHAVKMWSTFKEEIAMINNIREQKHKLPGVTIPDGVMCTGDVEEALHGTDAVVLALPSQTIRSNAKEISRYLGENKIIVCCSKGIEEGTCKLLSDVIEEEVPQARVAALSGPSHAEEIARGIPTTVVAASKEKEVAQYVQELFMSSSFRVYTNPDVTGVELGGAIKNVIALCAGISDGLGFGDNTKAALMTRGIAEISRLGIAMGAQPLTFAGLTGIGDLIVTCTSLHSRNRRAGILIGQGKTLTQALDEVKMVVEGVATTKPAYKLADEKGVSMPITTQAYEVLFRNKNPRQAVADLMMREPTHENTALLLNSDW